MKATFHFGLVALLSATPLLTAAEIQVSTHGAIPDDGKDDAAAIQATVDAAKDGDTVVFDAGTYDLIVPSVTDCYISISGKSGLTVRGALNDEGKPATTLLRHVTLKDRESLPRHISNRENRDITIENLVIDNSPRHTSAGEVIAVDREKRSIRVRVFKKLPMVEGTGAYAANVWLPTSPPVLKKVPSLTYGNSPGVWQVVDETNRVMEYACTEKWNFTDKIEPGELISWHFGTAGNNQMLNQKVDGLTLRNLRIPNLINNFTLIHACKDVTLDRLRFEPDGGQLAVGARDALHISTCTGTFNIRDSYIEGVRMDPIVFRSRYAVVDQVSGSNSLRIAVPGGINVPAGSTLGLWTKDRRLHRVEVASATFASKPTRGYDIETATPLPEWVKPGIELKLSAFMPDRVSITGCEFRNNGGCDVILFTDNATLSNNTHFRSMFPAIMIGSNNSSAGIAGSNIRIEKSRFVDCGWETKNGREGVIVVRNNNEHRSARVDHLVIEDNIFNGSEHGAAINLMDVYGGVVRGNRFKDVLLALHKDKPTTSGIEVTGNEGIDEAQPQPGIDSTAFVATASDSYPGRGPEFAIDGSGMIGEMHAAASANRTMWMAKNSSYPKWIRIDLGDTRQLSAIKIYNFNLEGYTTRGAENVEIHHTDRSTDPGNPVDNPSNWQKACRAIKLTQAPGKSNYGAPNRTLPDKVELDVKARWVAIKINSAFEDGICGLSEIVFE